MRLIMLLLLVPSLAFAECKLVQRNESVASGTIDQVKDVTANVVKLRDDTRQCTVNFEGKIAGLWYTGFGDYKWRNEMPDDVACANAFEIAKANLIKSVGAMHINSQTALVCNENNDPALKVLTPGMVLDEGTWRPHPEKPQVFWYQGTACSWFVETNIAGNDMRQWEGIVCRADGDKWVVVDKF